MDFCPSRSCADNLVTLSNNIQTAFLNGEVVVGAFLDIAGAFNNMLPEVIVDLEILGYRLDYASSWRISSIRESCISSKIVL